MDRNRHYLLSFILLALLSSGCSLQPSKIASPTKPELAYTATLDDSLVSRYAPIVTIENSYARYNQVGTAKANLIKDNEHIYIDPKHATFYASHREFTSASGKRYTNLIYRIHFERVPYGLIPFQLTAGRNGGLIFIITLNEDKAPILITSVHSCGCYLAFTPTSFLDKTAFPQDWNWQHNEVYGETLPATLNMPATFDEDIRPLIQLRDSSHRVMAINTITHSQAQAQFTLVHGELQPVKALKNLALPNNTTTSFYHEEGLQKGYVKGATKPLELLLMSWWAFDLFVGRDKEFGPSDETGSVFYTSLKPWQRENSDMWPFAKFLQFWGWQL